MAVRSGAGRRNQRGYAMAALLVALAVMAVMASVAMPAWRTIVQRENEEELIFRGQQYVRSIRLFQRKFANAYPPTIDLLIEQRFLRKKYTDPINKNGEFTILYQGMQQQPGRGGAAGAAGRGGAAADVPVGGNQATPVAGQQGAGPRGGIMGVASKSTEKSFRIYNGRSTYNQWQFVLVPQAQGRGAPMPGGRGVGPGGRGMQQPGGMSDQPGGMGGRGRGMGGPGGAGAQGRGGPGVGGPGTSPPD